MLIKRITATNEVSPMLLLEYVALYGLTASIHDDAEQVALFLMR